MIKIGNTSFQEESIKRMTLKDFEKTYEKHLKGHDLKKTYERITGSKISTKKDADLG